MKEKDKITKVKVHKLEWAGDMKEVILTLINFPVKALKVDGWFAPTIGELCLNPDNEIDVVKNIVYEPGNRTFKGANYYSFLKYKGQASSACINRIEVKKGKRFIFEGKIFVPQEPLCGSYIDKIARGELITEYEYEEFQ